VSFQVAGESEVKAQIKLRLRTSTQMPFVVVRSFQVRGQQQQQQQWRRRRRQQQQRVQQ
jgi:hypothetical protein